ncbi:phosphotransferase family protein [Blastococcus sp. BMG 814]|uniref:Phosphotransferase family protein n=1 Tax=Blastococcus carthaginiensis TaxID=3050034 RepID=A0ABT9IFH8_9ACTN|nr:phosphotransferase family protein [Blastococcus carthaginiensis]MDP5183894.1 phosphotransferase family protein [Blastococcus carthaginiensis]
MTEVGVDPLDLVDRGALTAFLAGCVEPFDQLTVTLLAGGASNLTYLVQLDDRRYVLRRRPLGPSAPKAHDMRREFTVLDALKGRGLPIPRVHAFSEDEDVVGAPFYLMDFRPGHVLHSPADAEGLSPAQAEQCSGQLIDILARLHALSPEQLQLPNFGRPEGFLERRVRSWLRQWNSVEHRAFPEVERIGELLLRNLPEQRYTALVHGDYRLGNVILDVEDGGASITAVLDWEMSTAGDPLTDVAHLLVYWEPTCGRVTHPAQQIAERPGFLSGAELVRLYEEKTDRDLSGLPFYLAFEHWRAAIIKDAIYLRRAPGQTQAEEFGATVRLHLDEAVQILDSLGFDTQSVAPVGTTKENE